VNGQKLQRTVANQVERVMATHEKCCCETPLDRFLLGVLEPHIESRGPASLPQNTFVTTHRFNTVVTNRGLFSNTLTDSIQLCCGIYMKSSPSTDPSEIAWDTVLQTGLLQSHSSTNLNAPAVLNGTNPTADTILAVDTFNGGAWDSRPWLVPQGGVEPTPMRVTGLRMTVETTSSALNTQGSCRGGDNGSVVLHSDILAAAYPRDKSGTISETKKTENTVIAPYWPDATVVTTGTAFTEFTRDPRVSELGPIVPGRIFEFNWIPTSADQLSYTVRPNTSFGGTDEDETANAQVGENQAASFLRRGPNIFVNLTGLTTSVEVSFRVRATLSVEHVVTPTTLGFLYDYSRRAPYYVVPWDIMAEIPTGGSHIGHILEMAGVRCQEEEAAQLKYHDYRPMPSVLRADKGLHNEMPSRAALPGTPNRNGAIPVLDTPHGEGIMKRLERYAKTGEHLLSSGVETAKAIGNSVAHFHALKSMYSHLRAPVHAVEELAHTVGPIVEEVPDAIEAAALIPA
jgi:hypothetical protein